MLVILKKTIKLNQKQIYKACFMDDKSFIELKTNEFYDGILLQIITKLPFLINKFYK